jgi:hypothetical protein
LDAKQLDAKQFAAGPGEAPVHAQSRRKSHAHPSVGM